MQNVKPVQPATAAVSFQPRDPLTEEAIEDVQRIRRVHDVTAKSETRIRLSKWHNGYPLATKKERCVAKSVLRWAGSKRKLLPKLSEFWVDPTRRYVEPFAGSAGLFFSVLPREALLGDINEDLVLFLNCAKSCPLELYELASSWRATRTSYYAIRATKPRTEIARAARFFYLNRYCFNGIYRTNKKGEFNVPFSGSRTGEFPTWGEFDSFARTLKRAEVVCEDFQSVLEREVGRSDFVYLDPPYALANRRVFRQYGPDSFGLLDLQRLKETLSLIDRRGAMFVLSYAYCKESIKYFSKWHQQRVFCQRNIAGFVSSRRRAAELIISNFAP